MSQLGGAVRKRAASVPEARVGRQLGFQHPIAAARLPHRGQQPLAHGLGRELCVEDALGCGRQLLDQIGLGPQKSLERSSVAKLTLGRCPSEKALGSHAISSEASLCQNSGSRHKNLPPLALERTSPKFHMLAWLVILFCLRLKKDWSEHAKLLEPRPRLCVLRCAGGGY